MIGEFLDPPIQFMKSIPVASFVILALFWTGAENLSIFISFIVVYPMIHVNTLAGLLSADPKLWEMARIFRVPVWKQAVYIYRGALYPYLKSACRTAWEWAEVRNRGRVIGVPDGSIGEGLYLSKIYLDTADLFAWTITIILISVIFEKGILAGSFIWQPERRRSMTASKLRIDIRGLEKSFGEERVLKGLDLSLSSGNFYCLMAPSGTGKKPLFCGS